MEVVTGKGDKNLSIFLEEFMSKAMLGVTGKHHCVRNNQQKTALRSMAKSESLCWLVLCYLDTS